MLHWVRATNSKLISSYFIILFFILWQVAPTVGWANPKFVPPLSKVLAAGWDLVQNGDLFVHISVSLERVFIGLFMAIIVGLPLGFI